MVDLVGEWRSAWAGWVAADTAGRPAPMCNKIMDRIWALSTEIGGQPELHGSIEALCEPEQDSNTRVHAALVREHWDVAGAAETLVSVIQASGASIGRPVTMSSALEINTTTTARTAALCLLNIDSGRGNTGI